MKRTRLPIILVWLVVAILTVLALVNAGALVGPIRSGQAHLGDGFFSLVPLFFALPAALIITRQPRNTIGWLMMVNPLVMIPSDAFSRYLHGFSSTPPETLPVLFIAWVVNLSWMALIFPILLAPLFFPTGRLLSRRWRWPVYLTLAMVLFLMFVGSFSSEIQPEGMPWTLANPIGFIPEEAIDSILGPWSLLLVVVTVASVASVMVRYRRGGPVERQQIKWLLYACLLFGLIYIPGVLINSDNTEWSLDTFFELLLPLSIITVPIAITIAILRFHLFDIDVIIRRTLQYSLLTALLALIYFGGVTLLGSLLSALFGGVQTLAIVLTTLAMAALFTPLRRWAQRFIDRRFYRSTYNTELVLTSFTNATRSIVTVDVLTEELLAVVEETLQPEESSLWLRNKPDR